ncbi:NAD-dependent epimerase/dehydratase family protein [Nodosilinea sp. PGN35]|uniref:NAD-dependent epimerase/dehydratase family protein n=1 Tax=Nodosilinea sp. PGN35 TaxID=3020489 RepID=UPI0023B319AF|nr:NAD(P)-dependent oxidoreductase [Nodosilinea sp. TSF1-S3]MDF0364664.1 NAD(P)-dependent oxidoreductase [Nodosilinea sp. TSF1-S3]
MPSSLLLTGTTGLLGRHLVQHLTAAGAEIHGIVRSQPPFSTPQVTYHTVDLGTEWSQDALPKQVDTVIHLAQSDHFRNFPEKAPDIFQVNIASTARLLDYARKSGVKTFIYASSGGVYSNSHRPLHENSPIIPLGQLSYYLGSKLCGEVLVQSYAAYFQVIVLRFFFMYGPGQKRSMLIPRLMDSVKQGRPIMLEGPEGLHLNPVHVEDAAAATAAALATSESATFNIAGPDILSLRQITEAIGEFLKTPPCFDIVDREPHDLIGDNTAMKTALVAPTRHLSDSLADVGKS